MLDWGMSREGLSGGGIIDITTTPVAVDLTLLQGYTCLFYCDSQDMNLRFSTAATPTTLTTTATAIGTNNTVAKPVGTGVKFERRVGKAKYLIVATQSGSGTLVIEPVGRPNVG